MIQFRSLILFLFFLLPLSVVLGTGVAYAEAPEELNRQADEALRMLTSSNQAAARIARDARAVLIFPKIIKAGFIFGAGYGEGVLRVGQSVDGYYNSVTGSWGLQAGAQSYGYAMFFMSDKALQYLRDTRGWEIGTGPTVVIVDQGAEKNLTSTTYKDDVYAYVFDQKGLMLGIDIKGTKISRLRYP